MIIKEFGPSHLIDMVMKTPYDKLCVDGLRSMNYIGVLREAGAVMIALTCPVRVRYDRGLQLSDRAKYPDSLKAFIENERQDESVANQFGLRFDMEGMISQADFHIDGSKPVDDVQRQLDTVVAGIKA
jgi:hypothetical protein